MSLFLPGRRTTKPINGACQIDWSNPLTRGLVFFAAINEGAGIPRDLVSGSFAVDLGGTYPWKASSGGLAIDMNTSGTLGYARNTTLEPLNITFMSAQDAPGGLSGTPSSFCKAYINGISNPYASWRNLYAYGGSSYFSVTMGISGNQQLLQTDYGLNPIKSHVSGGTYNSSTGLVQSFVNGFIGGSATFTGGISYDTSSSGDLIIGGIGTTAAQSGDRWSGNIYWTALWNRVLSPQEIFTLSHDVNAIWQILRPLR